MTNHDKLRKLAQNATPGPWVASIDRDSLGLPVPTGHVFPKSAVELGWANGDPVSTGSPADAEFIAAANPDVILNLLEELRITRAERDAEKHKNLVVKQELHLYKTQMREARAIAWDAGAQAGLDWDKNYPGNIRDSNPFKESK